MNLSKLLKMVILLPDDVEWDVPLEHMNVKDAVFVPTLNITASRTLIKKIAKSLEYEVEVLMAVEDGYLGVMVWRIS